MQNVWLLLLEHARNAWNEADVRRAMAGHAPQAYSYAEQLTAETFRENPQTLGKGTPLYRN